MCGNAGLLLYDACSGRQSSDGELNDIELNLLESMAPSLNPILEKILPPLERAPLAERGLPLLGPLEILQQMTRLTELRGGQSSGLASLSWKDEKVKICVAKTIVPKRERASSMMVEQWKRQTLRGPLASEKNSPFLKTPLLLQGHLRFATSSRNMVAESHPHIWTPFQKMTVYAKKGQGEGKDGLRFVKKRDVMVGHVLTHNGDFDAITLYEGPFAQKDFGRWLEKVTGIKSDVDSDSAKIAGYFDVFSTQFNWPLSARRAWILVIARNELDVCAGEDVNLSKKNTAPTVEQYSKWGQLFEEAFDKSTLFVCEEEGEGKGKGKGGGGGAELSFRESIDKLKEYVIAKLLAAKFSYAVSEYTTREIRDLVEETVSGFFTADAFQTMGDFMRSAHGSFGLCVASAQEPGGIVLAASGQPMCFAIDPEVNAVLYGSETNAIQVPVQEHKPPMRYRYDLNDHWGQVVRIGQPLENNLIFRELGIDKDNSSAASAAAGRPAEISPRMSPLKSPINLMQYDGGATTTHVMFNGGLEIVFDNLGRKGCDVIEDIALDFKLQSVASQTINSSGDMVRDDIGDIPEVVQEITSDWDRPSSNNRETANDFVHLLSDARFRHSAMGDNPRGLDLLITGIESSLWMGEQFAADLKIIFPKITVTCVSANKLLGALEAVPRMVHFCGYNRLRGEDLRKDRPVVLCLSQSGQTFATLHATRQLLSILGGNVFLTTGCRDSKMREAVIMSMGLKTGDRRVMCNLSNLRPSEASSLAACAMHHTLTELLIYLAQAAAVGGTDLNNELNVVKEDVVDFRDLTNNLSDNLSMIVDEDSKTGKKLRKQGRLWGQHISESWRVLVLCGCYICISVISGYPLFACLFYVARDVHWLKYLARALDALLYIFMPKLLCYFLRFFEGRRILARQGKRCLVICDVPWVHKNLENYVSKLFSLSYSPLSIEVHGSSAHDDMVHCFTHRVCRGTLLALGRPDGRILSLLKTERTVMLAAKQAAFIENMGVGPEIFTVGHNNVQSSIATAHVKLPSHRRRFLCEALFDMSIALSEDLSQQNFQDACVSILRDLALKRRKMGAAMPRRMMTIGIHHATDFLKSNLGGGGGSGGSGGSGGEGWKSPPSERVVGGGGGGVDGGDEGGGWARDAGANENDINTSCDSINTTNSDEDHAEEVLALTAEKKNTPYFSKNLNTVRWKMNTGDGLEVVEGVGGDDPETTTLSDPLRGSKHASASLSLDSRYSFTSKLPSNIRKTINNLQPIEHLYESRIGSLERFVSFLVMFHAMGKSVSNPWLLPSWNLAMSQSNLRVATTACPVSVEDTDKGEEGLNTSRASTPRGSKINQMVAAIDLAKKRTKEEGGMTKVLSNQEIFALAGGDDVGNGSANGSGSGSGSGSDSGMRDSSGGRHGGTRSGSILHHTTLRSTRIIEGAEEEDE